MARKNNHGGKRTPAKPAAVSGPGALSQRTDGGAGQPIRSIPGQNYGQGVALENQQAAAPMQAGPQGQPVAGGGGGPQPPPDLFRGTEQPGVDPRAQQALAQSDQRPSAFPQDPDMLLRYLQMVAPHPDIERLLDRD